MRLLSPTSMNLIHWKASLSSPSNSAMRDVAGLLGGHGVSPV